MLQLKTPKQLEKLLLLLLPPIQQEAHQKLLFKKSMPLMKDLVTNT
jgi:hypothetical protein